MSGIIEAQTTCRWDVVINRYFTPNSSGLEERQVFGICGSPVQIRMGVPNPSVDGWLRLFGGSRPGFQKDCSVL